MARPRKAKAKRRVDYFKYDPSVHGKDAFNIDLALNNNWDKTADEFERQEGEIEKVKNSIESSISGAIQVKQSLATTDDINNFTHGVYKWGERPINAPFNWSEMIAYENNGYVTQIITGLSDRTQIAIRTRNDSNVWSTKNILPEGSVVKVLPNQTGIDLNNINEPCEFYAQGVTNGPSSLHGYFKHEFHINTDGKYGKQTYTIYNTGETWVRTKVEGTWSAWKLPNVGTVGGVAPSGSYVPLDYLPKVNTNGTMEIGNILDFHLKGSTKDYDGRLYIDATGGFFYTNPTNGYYNMNIPLEIHNLKNLSAQGVVKSVQRGFVLAQFSTDKVEVLNGYTYSYFDVKINAINANKTMVNDLGFFGSSDTFSTARIINTTTLRLYSSKGTYSGRVFNWEVIEFY